MADLIERRKSIDPKGSPNMSRTWMDEATVEIILLRSTLSQEREAREKDREHIRKQAEDIMTLGALVYVNEHETWKDRAASLETERDDARQQRNEIGRA